MKRYQLEMIKILTLNIRSIFKKIYELNNLFRKYNIDFALLQETHHKNKLPKIFGYKNIGIPRNSNGGGVAIYSKQHYTISPIYSITDNELTKIECVGQIVSIGKLRLKMFSIYIPPTTPICEMEFLNKLDLENTIICGDFNSHSPGWSQGIPNSRGKFLQNLISETSEILNRSKTPTCLTLNKQPSTPDLVLLGKNLVFIEAVNCLIGNDINSDHLPIITEIKPKKVVSTNKTIYPLKNLNINKYQTLLNKLRLNHFCKTPLKSPKTYDEFVNSIITCWKTCCKAITITNIQKINGQPWFNEEIKLNIKLRNKARKQLSIKPSLHNLKFFKKLKTLVKNLIKNAKCKFWEKFSTKKDLNELNKLVRNTKRIRIEQEIQKDNKPIEMNSDIASKFGNLMQSFENTNNQRTRISKFKNKFDNEILVKLDEKPSKCELIEIVNTLNVKKANGIDEISNAMIKLGGEPMIKLLRFFFTLFLSTGQFPSGWKKCNVILIPKSNEKILQLADLRPIALLSNISKVFEKLILLRIKKLDLVPSITSENQTGFKSNKGTDWNMSILKDKIQQSRTDKQASIILFIDISKAYDTINRSALLKKLMSKLNGSKTFEYLKWFLGKRAYRFQYKDGKSNEINLKLGLPQGSALSPLLFNVYTESLTKSKNVFGFADDLILIGDCNTQENLKKFKKNLKKLTGRIRKLGLNVNPKKTKMMIVGNIKPPIIRINKKIIENVSSFKYLGVWFDSNNTFDTQTKSIISKTNRRAGQLKFMLHKINGCSTQCRLTIYKTHIRPLLEYGSNIWSSISKEKKAKLESVQHKILCSITGTHWRTAKKDILLDCKMQSLECRRDIFFVSRWKKSLSNSQNLPKSEKSDKKKDNMNRRFYKLCEFYNIDSNSILKELKPSFKVKISEYWYKKMESEETRDSNDSKLTVEVIRKTLLLKRKLEESELEKGTPRKIICSINQARYGTLPLNYFLNKIGGSKNKKCKAHNCSADETRIHFLFYCTLYEHTRKKLFRSKKVKNKAKQIEILTETKWRSKVAKFIKEATAIRKDQ